MPALRTPSDRTTSMSVSVIIPSGLRVFTDNKETIDVYGNTVGECLEYLAARYPAIEGTLFFERGKLFDFGNNKISIFLNKIDARPDALLKPVNDGDIIHILLSISGG
jgi:molybdopterin converting factor small subunit